MFVTSAFKHHRRWNWQFSGNTHLSPPPESVQDGGFPGGLVVKNLPASAGDSGSVPESGRPPGDGNDNPIQYSCLGNSMDRGATVHALQSQIQLTDSTQ